VPIGTVVISGMSLDMQPYPWPLRYDADRGTLSGNRLEAAVPVYRIPVEFRRTEPVTRPAKPAWDFPKPRMRWSFDTGAPVRAGIKRDSASGLIYVGNDAGTLYALDADGKESWTFATRRTDQGTPGGDRRCCVRRIGYRLFIQARYAHWHRALARKNRLIATCATPALAGTVSRSNVLSQSGGFLRR
jgi:hypothetical protein